MFFAFAGYVQGIILPWAISNNKMPIWADILLVTLILLMWIFALERIAKAFSKIKDDNEKFTNW